MNKIVTSGKDYLDIDAYSSMVAYAELVGGIAAGNAPLNKSIVDDEDRILRNYQSTDTDEFIIMDISNPKIFDNMVRENQIGEIIDHHPGFEQYWRERGVKTQIEKIGAVATIIWERWRDAGKLDELSRTSGELLMQGILDNTLNFLADITSDRDKIAYADLVERFGDIREKYFKTVEQKIVTDLRNSLENDMKVLDFKTLGREINFYQLAVWDTDEILKRENEVSEIIDDGMLNLISISKGESQIMTNDETIRGWITKLMSEQKLFLRKEVIKRDLEATD